MFVCVCQDVNKEQGLLDIQQSEFPIIQTLMEKKQPYEQLWTTGLEFHTKSDEWMNGKTSIAFILNFIDLFRNEY